MAKLLPPANAVSTGRKPVVLVVEDNEDDFFLLNRALQRTSKGSRVEWARDGQEAIEFLESAAIRRELPACILVDLKMPRMDGFALLSILRVNDRFRGIPVNVLTTSVNPTDSARALDLGVQSFLVKPSTYAALVEMTQALRVQWSDSATGTGGTPLQH
jgi:two-component system, response regulator